MIKIKLSPSKIEKFRQWNEGEFKRDESDKDVITKEMLIETISGTSKWTPKAEFGSAFHAVMRYGAAKYFNPETKLYHIQDEEMPTAIVCEYSEIELADKYHFANPDMVWETWHTHKHTMGEYEVFIQMRLDGIQGFKLKEHKTTARGFDYSFYRRSLQWKIYLLATGAPLITYEVFPYKEPAELAEGKTRRANARDKREVFHEHFTFYPYGTMISEVNQNIRGLINFCEFNGLMDKIIDTYQPQEVSDLTKLGV